MGERSRDNDNNNNDRRSGEQRSNDNNPQQSSDGVDGPSCGLNNAPTKSGEQSNDNDNNNPRQSTDDADGPVCGLNNAPTKSEEQSKNNAHLKSEERSNDNDSNAHSKSEERSNDNDINAHSKSEERYNDNDNNITTSSEDNTMRGDGEPGGDHHNEPPQHENTKEEPFVEKDNNQRMEAGNSPPSSQGSPPCNTTNDTSRPQFNDNSKNEPPDKKTSEGDNSDNQTPSTGSKTTDQERSSASQSDDKTTDEASADNDNPMCVLNNVPSEPMHSNVTSDNKENKTVQDDNPMCVLDNAPSPSPSDGRNSGASNAQQKTHGQQQYVEDENDISIHNNNTSSSHKSQSYSHQLRTNTGTNIKRHRPQLQNKHSLDDTAVTNNYHGVSDYEDDDYGAYETGDGSASGAGSSIIFGNSSYEYSTPADGQSLPEFVGNDSNAPDIFKAPRRAAVHPNRPQFVELRPHPLRETQVGKFLRTIASTDKQLWAGQECGVRVWRLSDAYAAGIGVGGRARRGDEDAAPCYESVTTPPTMCLMIDSGSKLVWSGHKDGKIRSWNMDIEMNDNPFHEGLSWQAHRGPVLTMVISSYGDLWTGSEGGVIHVYPWEAIDKSLSLKIEERHMASLLVERSCVNLRTQVTVNGVCNISSQDVKVLLCDKVVAKVWAFGTYSISLWDARTRELIKVYNVDGHIENRADMPQVQDQGVEDEINVKLVSKSKKEKPHGFLQRSRNAIMGAAGAVRRAATKSGNEESKTKTEAVVLASNGMIYSGCTNGLIVQWDGNGTRLQEFNHHPCAVLCFCTYGSRIWVGYVSGMVQVLDLDGSLIAGWVAHNGPVIKMVAGNGHVFSLATHGGIRGWNIASPGPLDQIIRPELAKKELCYTRRENIKILVGTWNVGQGKPSHDALMTWVGSAVSDVGIFVVGLQEVEMGAGFLAMSAAKETVGLEGSSIGHLWQDAIGKSLGEGSLFERVGSRQLAGLLIAIWVRTSIRTYVGDLDAGAVACGLGRTFGNKGGVGLRLRVYDRIMCFVNCHFAAHLEAVNRRNADFSHIYRSMAFSRSSNVSNNASAGVSSSAQGLRGTNTTESNPGKGKPDLAEADMVIFCGDFNYRLFGISYDDARDLVSQRSFDWLRERDQLRAEMKAGKVFQGMREAIIRFTPTYKFDRGKPGLGGYDSGEKKRIPAWCDRILYRDNRSSSAIECSLECPVVASILQYDSCMDVLESDHKPVRCKLNVEIAHVDRSKRRQEMGKIINSHEAISSLRNELCFVPKTDVSTKRIVLKNQETSSLKITNKSATDKAIFQIICEGQASVQEDGQPLTYNPRGAFGFPRWLEVIPASGVIAPDQVADIIVRHDDVHTTEQLVDGLPQTWSAEDTRDKEVLLKVVLIGCCSLETKSHTVQVHYCYSPKATQTDSSKGGDSLKGSGSKKHHGSTHNQNRSDNDESKSSHGSEKKSKS